MLNWELDEVTLTNEYEEYLREWVAAGNVLKPRTIHQFKNMGRMFFPEVKLTNTVNEPKPITKADIARQIFEEELKKGLVRKVVISRFMNEAGLTIAGAGTYFANYKTKMLKQQEKTNVG
jgi:hypothetical protein